MARSRPASNSETAALAEYSTKRAFDATPEPGPEPVLGRTGPLLFVVQQHAARRLHFDFRLELDGVLKSWAVPKGLQLAPGDSPHLAVPTEDHPLAYGAFEGVIPKGQYGAGNVIVWDCGIYSPDEGGEFSFDDRAAAEARVRAELAAGKLSIFLLGEKLKGSYALVRTKDKSWLLLKHRDKRALRAAASDSSRSVLTPYAVTTVPNLAANERLTFERLIPAGPSEGLPAKLAPMLAGTAEAPFNHRDWLFEPKLDGYRVLAHVSDQGVRLRSRRGLDLTDKFPGIVEDLEAQLALPMVLDGEIVAFRAGRPSFGALQDRAQLKSPVDIAAAERSTPCVFFCFDLLHALGMNLRDAPYTDRRRWLAQCLLPAGSVQLVHAEADGDALYRAAVAAGFEGMMAKRRASVYRPGQRSDDWLKIKHVQTAEFVIGGYTEGKGARRDSFGALALGAWDGDKLVPVGNVGSGFDEGTIARLLPLLKARATRTMPFATAPVAETKLSWVRPELVAEVQFAGFTDDHLLRAPVFLRLRDDVDPRSVRGASAPDPAAGGTPVDSILEQLSSKSAALTLSVGEHRIKLTHLDKPLWPAREGAAAITKRDLLRYLAAVAPFMVRHLQDRPLTVIRMPDGIAGELFFQKHWDRAAVPPFVRLIDLVDDKGAPRTYVMCNNIATLLWLGQMATIEFHAPHASVPAELLAEGGVPKVPEDEVFDRPDYIVFDLDPYIYAGHEPKGAEPEYSAKAFAKAREVALHLREILVALSLRPFVKTTGKTGLHVFVPIERTIDVDQAREACRIVGEHLRRQFPKDITMDWAVEKRTGRIFFDHNMNGRGRTLSAAYSPRRIPGAWIGVPLTWEELPDVEPDRFRLSTVPERLRENGDPWQGILDSRHDLTRMLNLPG